jgi:hypothetical protein
MPIGVIVPPLMALGRENHAAHARDDADAGDDAAAEHVLLAVVVVHAKAGQGGQLQPG